MNHHPNCPSDLGDPKRDRHWRSILSIERNSELNLLVLCRLRADLERDIA